MPNAAANAQSGAMPGAVAGYTPCFFNEMCRRNCVIMAQLGRTGRRTRTRRMKKKLMEVALSLEVAIRG